MTDRTDDGTAAGSAAVGAPPPEGDWRRKLARLAETEGFDDVSELLTAAALDCVCPAIRVNPGREYAAGMEPDRREGCCEACGTRTVRSALVPADLI